MMKALNLPAHQLELKNENKQVYIKDIVRKKWLVLTPEEWVRQHFINFLIHDKSYPASLMAVEKGITVNGLNKRCDILAFDRLGVARVLIECKAPEVSIDQKVFDQIARYNLKLNVDFLVVTNGLNHYYCKMNYAEQRYDFLKALPDFDML